MDKKKKNESVKDVYKHMPVEMAVEVLVPTKVKKGNKIVRLERGIITKPWKELLVASENSPGILHQFRRFSDEK